jgi:hypothetical protein
MAKGSWPHSGLDRFVSSSAMNRTLVQKLGDGCCIHASMISGANVIRASEWAC